MRSSDWSSDVCSSSLGRQSNPVLARGGDNADRYRHPLVGRPCRSRGRLDHEGNIGAGWPPKPQTRRQLTDMIRHCLIPRRIVGQLGYVQTKLLRDESGEIMGYRSEEHTSELQSLMRISYAVFCLKKKTNSITSYHNAPNEHRSRSQD